MYPRRQWQPYDNRFSDALSTHSNNSNFTTSTGTSKRSNADRALHFGDRIADATMLTGGAVTAFSPLDWSGITAITGAGIVGAGAVMKVTMFACKKCKVGFKEVGSKLKHKLGLCDGCSRCL
ncbi:hypothetical protein K458DRAFT_421937 [Lentithecium fluviatile CBS 122367]|uniref:Uncharacterized protein n=1 Tax=Lentithecium fluviatile CBS 122367 TaxID=1168545 RepID=A0A6G1IPD4_9PLEO|nr:hypothetical protein K458DRAFT_421937 [Lentithecium fluviatile CBS 122367]